jgi:hypothetical protein
MGELSSESIGLEDATEVELTPQDVELYTQGRLVASNPLTQQLLTRALAQARRQCGWVVTPAKTETLYLDGPGTQILSLPTMNMTALNTCTENNIDLDVSTLAWSRRGLIQKTTGGPCSSRWSNRLGAIQVNITHGYSVDDAADWRGAVLAAIDLLLQNIGPQLQQYTVDDVQRNWFKSAQFTFDAATMGPYMLIGVA